MNKTDFQQDAGFSWSLAQSEKLLIELGESGWIAAVDFERDLLKAGCPISSDCASIWFSFANGSKLLLDALARLLALCNQLSDKGKGVTLDFSACTKTLTYLDRIGFIEHLDQRVTVLPWRPAGSAALVYEGNNEGVVELRVIAANLPNQSIPSQLQSSFVACAGNSYSEAAFTVVSELFGNVQEHSCAKVAGFAGLQYYKNGNKIQTVISDNGLGIIGTLEPVLRDRYPKVAQELTSRRGHAGVALLSKVFSVGGLSQINEDGRGLGLKRSGQLAGKYNAKISIRQSDFELCVSHRQGNVAFTHQLNLVRLEGTHICFNFDLTQLLKSG